MSTPLEELTKLRSGGAYIPPAKLKALLAQVEISKDSEEFQKLKWEQLKKSLNGLINKVNKSNIKDVVVELFSLNLVRGKGTFIKSLMKSQAVSLHYTSIYAALICVLNSKIPEIGELLVVRLMLQFKRSSRRNDKDTCKATLLFIAQLVNFQICHEILVLQIIQQLLENPNDDSVELACVIISEVGPYLNENSKVATNAIFERFRNILNEGLIQSRVQFLVEELLSSRRTNFDNKEIVNEELDLVEEDDKITHTVNLSDKVKGEEWLNVFQYDKEYELHEKEYNTLKKEILGDEDEEEEESESESASGDGNVSDSGSDSEFESESEMQEQRDDKVKEQIKDLTEQELTNFQKTVYLTMRSSMGPEEAVHKLLKLQPIDPARKEVMLIDMIVKCCAQEKTYSKYYSLIGENLVSINKKWQIGFDSVFKQNYEACHTFETSLIRNIASFWGHMFASDKMGWESMQVIKLTETESTSSGRIFLKFMFLKMQGELGVNTLVSRVSEEYIKPFLLGMFPDSNADHLRFSINFFTAIGLGILTEGMRDNLNNLPPESEDLKEGAEEQRGRKSSRSDSRSRSGSYASYSSYSRSRSGSYSSSRSGSYSRSPSRGRSYSRDSRGRSYSRTASYSRSRSGSSYSRGRSYSGSRSNSYSRSRTPSSRRSDSRSPSPSSSTKNNYYPKSNKSDTPLESSRNPNSFEGSRTPSSRRSESRSSTLPPHLAGTNYDGYESSSKYDESSGYKSTKRERGSSPPYQNDLKRRNYSYDRFRDNSSNTSYDNYKHSSGGSSYDRYRNGSGGNRYAGVKGKFSTGSNNAPLGKKRDFGGGKP